MGREGQCATCGNEYVNVWQHYNENYPSHKPDHWPECPGCDERYKHLGKHWHKSDCEYPNLTQHQYEIVIGLLMGDGWINKYNGKPRLQCGMITKEYLEYLDEIFGIFSVGIHLKTTAEESAKSMRDRDFSPNAKEENYSDLYYWQSRKLPQLEEFVEWYESGSKVWPEDIDLTPTVLKHWYVGDGCYSNNSHIVIGLSNESESEKKVRKFFERSNIPHPNRWVVRENTDGSINCTAQWNVSESYELWEYMLEDGHGIPPGFKYKWPEEFH
jgi:hypothetical protein